MTQKSQHPQSIQKVEPVRILEQAVDQIRNLIRSGELEPGEKLPTEMELGRLLDVGRSSVREALRVLEAEGLVEVRRGSGTYVSTAQKLSNHNGELAQWLHNREQTLEQVLEVRESIEGLTAALAASRASKEQLEKMSALVSEFNQKIKDINEDTSFSENLFDELARLDAAFHLEISNASGNDIAAEIINHILPAFNQSNKTVIYLYRKALLADKEHLRILQAIQAGDKDLAEKTMRQHIQRVRKDVTDASSQG